MRFSGQGMMSHTATTTISRYFTKSRGKALSTGWFGLSTAEFILPVSIIYLLTIIDWRDIWITISIVVIVFLPLASFILVKNLNLDSREKTNENDLQNTNIKNLLGFKGSYTSDLFFQSIGLISFLICAKLNDGVLSLIIFAGIP